MGLLTDAFRFVLVSAGIELIFLSVAAVFWIYYKRNVDSTDVFSCWYESRTFSSLSYSANEQVCRSWERA